MHNGCGTAILITSVRIISNSAANMMSKLTFNVIVSVVNRTGGNVLSKGVTGKIISLFMKWNANMRRQPGEVYSQIVSLQEINDTNTLVSEITISWTRRQQ